MKKKNSPTTRQEMKSEQSERSVSQRVLGFQINELLVLALFFFVSIFIRFLVIQHNQIFFFFDQSRDASTVYEMVHGHPIKVQGPSASGTSDSVYHGVLYYYLLIPGYLLGNGNPFYASLWLGVITSLTIFPLFLIAKKISGSSLTSYTAVGMFVFSFEATQMGTWLSNPGFAVLTITLFYLFLWKVFFQNETKHLMWLALFLGLTNQAVIYSAYLWLILAGVYFFNQNKLLGKEPVKFSWKEVGLAGLVYLASISTMIVNQLLLLKNGLFHPASTLQTAGGLGQLPFLSLLQEVFGLFLKNIQYAFIPTSTILSFLLLIFCFVTLKRRYSDDQKFLLIWFFAPLALLLFVFRNGYHVLIGLTPVLYVIFAMMLIQLSKMQIGKLIAGAVFCLFLLTQLLGGREILAKHSHIAGLQKGASLQQELELIDKTYQLAAGQPFSISTITIPYGYNTTWSYLYHWYGQKTYGYLPSYVGPTQSGILGGGFIKEQKQPDKLHFSIQEPTEGLPEVFVKQFGIDQQVLAGTPSAQILFGSLRLQVRDGKK